MGDSGYTNGNRAFLQAILARGTITFEQAQPVIAEILNADGGDDDSEIRPDQITNEDFMSYIEVASEAASKFDYEIRSAVHQKTKKRIYALVNTTSDPQTQLATTYSPDELSFIKRVLDAMFDKYNSPRMEVLAITEMQAIKLARPNRRESVVDVETSTQQSADKGLKHSEVETVLGNLVDGGWFEKSREGFYCLSPRALLELRPWLIETYNDPDIGPQEWQRIKFCEACKDIVTIGLRCSDPDCNFRLHDICEGAFWRTRRDQKCPKCSKEWTAEKFIGERSVTMTESYQKRRRAGGGRRNTLADDIIREEGGEIDDAEEGEEDAEGDDADGN